MKSSVAIGTAGLDDKDLVLLRSALKLRMEEWTWVDAAQQADVWIVDAAQAGRAGALASSNPRRLIVLAGDPAAVNLPQAEVIAKPLKAVQLMRVLDRLLACFPVAPSGAPPLAQAQPAAAEQAAVHPWLGRRIRLLRAPSFSKYPVTVEMMGWVQSICQAPVSYDALMASLPLDRDLLNAILDAAARDGQLVDESGATLPPMAERKAGLMGRLFGK